MFTCNLMKPPRDKTIIIIQIFKSRHSMYSSYTNRNFKRENIQMNYLILKGILFIYFMGFTFHSKFHYFGFYQVFMIYILNYYICIIL